MKVLFLYHDKTHAWPLFQAIPELENRNIHIEAFNESIHFEVQEYDFKQYDLILIHQQLLNEEVFKLSYDRPVVILERVDGCQLGVSRRWIEQAAGVFKGYTFRDPSLHNKYRGRAFIGGLNKQTKNTAALEGTPKQISDKDLEKIHVVYGFGAYERLSKLLSGPLNNERPISVNFMGTVDYNGTEVQEHRLDACKAAAKIPNSKVEYGRNIPFDKYLNVMRETKTVLSPYGWGEPTYRDYEAALLGCLIIRPKIIDILSFPDFYIPGSTFFPCDPDFSNIDSTINYINVHWGCLEPSRIRIQKLALECRDSAKIAKRFQTLLEKIV